MESEKVKARFFRVLIPSPSVETYREYKITISLKKKNCIPKPKTGLNIFSSTNSEHEFQY